MSRCYAEGDSVSNYFPLLTLLTKRWIICDSDKWETGV